MNGFGKAISAINILLHASLASAAFNGTVAARTEARAAVAAYVRQQAPQQLKADEIQQMQSIGQILLSAESHRHTEPADEGMRQDIKALQKELDIAIKQLSKPTYTAGGRMHLQGKAMSGSALNMTAQSSAAPATSAPPTSIDAFTPVRGRLVALQERIDTTSKNLANASSKSDSRKGLKTSQLAAKSAELQRAAQAAIDAKPARGNLSKLVQLRDRLKERKISDFLANEESTNVASPTPTLKTLIKHR